MVNGPLIHLVNDCLLLFGQIRLVRVVAHVAMNRHSHGLILWFFNYRVSRRMLDFRNFGELLFATRALKPIGRYWLAIYRGKGSFVQSNTLVVELENRHTHCGIAHHLSLTQIVARYHLLS